MSENRTPGVPGQGTDLSSISDPLDFLEAFQEYLDHNLPRVRAACERLDERIRAERAALDEEEDAPDTEEEPRPAGIAFLSDGRTALHVSHLGGAELKGRETWTGVVLHFAEACDVLSRLTDAADEAAGHVAGGILFGFTRRDKDEDDGGAAQP